jgi:hypothetical protein
VPAWPAVDRQQLLRNFQKKKAAGEIDPYGDLVNGIHPDWLKVCLCVRYCVCMLELMCEGLVARLSVAALVVL